MRQKHNKSKKHLAHERQEARLFPADIHNLGYTEQTSQYDKDK